MKLTNSSIECLLFLFPLIIVDLFLIFLIFLSPSSSLFPLLSPLLSPLSLSSFLTTRGYRIGVRLIDEFLAQSPVPVGRCKDLKETADVISKVCIGSLFL